LQLLLDIASQRFWASHLWRAPPLICLDDLPLMRNNFTPLFRGVAPRKNGCQ
jgi:hypothetical protein